MNNTPPDWETFKIWATFGEVEPGSMLDTFLRTYVSREQDNKGSGAYLQDRFGNEWYMHLVNDIQNYEFQLDFGLPAHKDRLTGALRRISKVRPQDDMLRILTAEDPSNLTNA